MLDPFRQAIKNQYSRQEYDKFMDSMNSPSILVLHTYNQIPALIYLKYR